MNPSLQLWPTDALLFLATEWFLVFNSHKNILLQSQRSAAKPPSCSVED